MKKRLAAVLVLLSLGAVAHGQNRPATSQPATNAAPRAVATRGRVKGVKSVRDSRAEPAEAVGAKSLAGVDGVDRLLEIWDLAQGGAAFNRLTSRVVRGRIEMSGSHATGSFVKYVKNPRKSLMVANTPGGQFIEASDGERTWLQTPWGEAVSAGYGDEAMSRPAPGRGGPKWRQVFSAASLKGMGRVDGRETFVLAATLPGRPPMLWHFDATTGLLSKLEFATPAAAGKSGQRLLGVYFDGYMTVDGVKVPSLFRQVYEKFTLTFRVTEVRHNVHIEDALFANPKGK